MDITNALNYVHSQSIWHRDLKSGNVLVHKDVDKLRAKLTDFGEAKVLQTATQKATKGIGTLCWMAPEIVKGQQYTEKADVYSYGIILWQLAARSDDPYKEEPNQFAITQRVLEGRRPEIPKDCDPGYARFIQWCWHQEPEERPHMKQVQKEFNEYHARFM